MNNFLLYLIEVTLYTCVFAICYRFLFQNLTHFDWNRWYLIFGLLISILAPFITDFIELGNNETSEFARFPLLKWKFEFLKLPLSNQDINKVPMQIPWPEMNLAILAYLLTGIYVVGFIIRSWQLAANIFALKRLIRTGKVVEKTKHYILYEQNVLPAFSFWNHIFLHKGTYALPAKELEQIILHETIHVRQKHTADILIFEIAGAVFWFNPVIRYLANSIRLTHEYIVDSIVAEKHGDIISYSKLLVKLSTANIPVNFAHSFSDKQIFFRISMLTKTRSVSMQKLKFLFVLPMIAATLTLSSFVKNEELAKENEVFGVIRKPHSGIRIRKIKWIGSTLYTDQELSKIAGVKPGDYYDEKAIDNNVYGSTKDDLASLYMDQGYLFFRIEIVEKKVSDKVDLEISVYEGNKVKVGKIILKGNGDVPVQEVLNRIAIKPGELFNRTKLIKAQRSIAEMGKFNPKNVNINPFPDEQSRIGDGGYVDLEFTVERK